MINELNKVIGIVHNDLKENKNFGSLFQFWVSQLTSEIEQRTNLTEKESHDLAINCVKRIHQ